MTSSRYEILAILEFLFSPFIHNLAKITFIPVEPANNRHASKQLFLRSLKKNSNKKASRLRHQRTVSLTIEQNNQKTFSNAQLKQRAATC